MKEGLSEFGIDTEGIVVSAIMGTGLAVADLLQPGFQLIPDAYPIVHFSAIAQPLESKHLARAVLSRIAMTYMVEYGIHHALFAFTQ